MLLRLANRTGPRAIYYVAAYWALNIVLVVAEARWHLIYRLMLWDIAQLSSFAPFLSKLAHAHG